MNPVFLIQKYNVLSLKILQTLYIQKISIVRHNFRWLGNLHYSFDGSSAFQINQDFGSYHDKFIYIYFDRVQLKTVHRC